jgi:hypothetical protein
VAHLADVTCTLTPGMAPARCTGHAVAGGNRSERPTVVVFRITPDGTVIPTCRPSPVFCQS